MTDPNYRIEWGDGSATEVAFRLLPLVQLEIEERHGAPFHELVEDRTKNSRVLAEAIWRFFQLRKGETRDFVEWFGDVDDIVPVGKMAEAIQVVNAAAAEAVEPPPFDGTGSPSASSGSPAGPANPFSS